MVTPTLEFNNSVSLNPRRKPKTALQKKKKKIQSKIFLAHFDEAELQMLHKAKQAVHHGWTYTRTCPMHLAQCDNLAVEKSVLLISRSCPCLTSQTCQGVLSWFTIIYATCIKSAYHFSPPFKRITAGTFQNDVSGPISEAKRPDPLFGGNQREHKLNRVTIHFYSDLFFSVFLQPRILI